ncbi:hypothetical protein GCM10007108_14290 [Thermogymnomonas acidicola]|uniref:Uncharacterized protein n=1 Tax=Thermogymnomonas acidicola TaxID=399579 RepID=A0AA37BS61_9ARCH|nr:hypothetical protein [Thermogymnomonas acidicola]GGM77278.1 hypothetical protein GCM10007108_14290 [Thermogymnomonas acidicola]
MEGRATSILRGIPFPVAASLLSSSLILTEGYAYYLIYLLGYTNQFPYLFAGLVGGISLFTFLGYLLHGRHSLAYKATAAVVLSAGSLLLVRAEHLVVPNTSLLAVTFMVTAVCMPIAHLYSPRLGVRGRIASSFLSSLLSVLIVLAFAVLYEASGQQNLAELLDALVYVSLAVTVAMFLSPFSSARREIRN